MHVAKSWMMRALLASAVMLTSACSDNNRESVDPGLSEQTLTLDDAQIVRVLQVANEGEVALGTLGQSRATTEPVRDFSAEMVTEHTAARQQLDALAAAQGIRPADSEVSMQLMEEVQRLMMALDGLEGERFDLALMDAQLAAHARTAMLADALLAPQAQNEALQQELRVQRMAVQKHLEEALPIQKALFEAP
ncbi:DUF4142 domain-containing protein [Myxococcus qinghaiensis]|uniref:DUF4142 domain-containing protein n=1 Tax=Myxococcus qinghaiensis TaxID=2906758 RepID=UPI0020A802D2|nr:DUF4142 domain-containing protein [Myxococcus qinghaiensis]MCP3165103.1 DUF4142 domain-containing protein [Myxococcus qinghaiensis]